MNEEKYIKIFCSEVEEHINAISAGVRAIQSDPENNNMITIIMQRLHSIKGIAGTMGYSALVNLSHLTEDFIASYTKKKAPLDENSLRIIYEVIDTISEFKSSLPQIRNDLIEESTKKISAAITGKEILSPIKVEKIDEKIKSGIDEITKFIDNSVKVNVSKLNDLIDEISELKYTKSALEDLNKKIGSYKLKLAIKKCDNQIKDMYQSLLQLKMQPFDTILNPLERIVSEYSLATGKKINFVANTGNIVIDVSVLKALTSPLIHLIKNAMDHGIEPPEERKRIGKSERGTVALFIKKISDFMEVTIEDDGRGVLIDAVIKKALQLGYIKETPEVVDGNFLISILTRPNFTTKETVSTTSGRGIGFGAVKSLLDSIGGAISLETKKNIGSKVTIKAPITTAVIRAILAKAGKEIVAIPVAVIEKILLVKRNAMTNSGCYLYEGEQVKVEYLSSILGFSNNENKDEHNVLLTKYGDKRKAFLVDEIISEDDFFIKPLPKPLKRKKSLIGYSILGSGAPLFVLDVNNL